MKIKSILIIVILLFLFNCGKTSSQDDTEFTLIAGDTAKIVPIQDAYAVFITIKDSAMAGTDSVYIALYDKVSGVAMYSTFVLYDLSETKVDTAGVSTYTSALVKPTDGLTKTYAWFPGGQAGISGVKWTGDMYFARLNQPPTAAGYQPKTRIRVQVLQ